MARPPWLDYPGLHYHVTAQGENKRAIFSDARDYEFLEHLLASGLGRFGFSLHAYCLMPNHIHLLLESTQGSLSECMDWVLGRYARRFNWRHERVGRLFQGRFLAKIVAHDAYLPEICRYIHMNPVKARLAACPEDYRWTSMGAYSGTGTTVAVCTERVLGYFDGPDPAGGFRAFTSTRRADGAPRKECYAEAAPEALERSLPSPAAQRGAKPVQRRLQEIARVFGCGIGELIGGWRNPRLGPARAMAMLALRLEAGMTLGEIAGAMGLRSAGGAGLGISRLLARLKRDPRLRVAAYMLGIPRRRG